MASKAVGGSVGLRLAMCISRVGRMGGALYSGLESRAVWLIVQRVVLVRRWYGVV